MGCCWQSDVLLFNILSEVKSESEVSQSCRTLCNPMDCSLPGSSIHGIFQARILEWVAISFSRDLPNPGIKPGSLALGRHFTIWPTRKVHILSRLVITFLPRSKCLLISWLQSPSAVILEPKNRKCHFFHFYSFYLPCSDGTRCHDLTFWNVEF